MGVSPISWKLIDQSEASSNSVGFVGIHKHICLSLRYCESNLDVFALPVMELVVGDVVGHLRMSCSNALLECGDRMVLIGHT